MERLPDAALKDRIIVFINYLLKSGKATQKEVGQVIKEVDEKKGAKLMETAYDKIMNKGLQLGSQLTAVNVALRLLNKRFGKIDNQAETMVKRLSTSKAEDLAVALLDFQKLEDLTVWLDENDGDLSLK